MDKFKKCLFCDSNVPIDKRAGREYEIAYDCPKCGKYAATREFSGEYECNPTRVNNWIANEKPRILARIKERNKVGVGLLLEKHIIETHM